MRAFVVKLSVILVILPIWGWTQVIDEFTLPVGERIGVGADSSDFFAQSFRADVRVARKLGVWLRQDSTQGEVQIQLYPSDTAGLPDIANPLYVGPPIIAPDTGLAFFVDSNLVISLELGRKYFLAIGSQSGGSGYVAAGVSGTYTDTGEELIRSQNNGQNWDTIPGSPLAVLVEGEDCTVPFALFSSNDFICGPDSVLLEVGASLLQAQWSTGETTFQIFVTQPDMYSVTVIDSQFCSQVDSVFIGLGTVPDANLDTTITFCAGRSVTLVPTQGLSEYLWSTGANTSFITGDTSGLFWVMVENLDGCTDRDTAILIQQPLPSPTLGPDSALCQGSFLILDPGPYQQYLWNNGATTRTITASVTSDWSVEVTDQLGCVGRSDTVTITVNPNPPAPTISLVGDILFSSQAFGYQWFFEGVILPGETNVDHDPTANGFYTVQVTNEFGCTATSAPVEILTEVTSDFIPEGFSPNGDGINDEFRIGQIEFFPQNELVVFNRWGKEVFRQRGYLNGWYGTGPNGGTLPTGTYYYVLDLGDGSEVIRGALMIQR